jgi:DNA-directed RNA polymerase subunit RPC12/RpoP
MGENPEHQEYKCSVCGCPLILDETRTLGKCLDCLKKEDEKSKALPALEKKEENKQNVLSLSIDLDALYGKVPKYETPENQDVWKNKEEMSPEYIKLNQTLQILAMFIARNCNEGPEVKDNINKRLALISTVLRVIVDNLAITGYDCYGLLTELLQDMYLKVSGKKHILRILAQIEQMQEQLAQEKSEEYTS